jgi:integrase
MYLTATMTGMRQGDLCALRWRDVDWSARRIRVQRDFVRGRFGTPKSKRSTRGVPLATRDVALFIADDDGKVVDGPIHAVPASVR